MSNISIFVLCSSTGNYEANWNTKVFHFHRQKISRDRWENVHDFIIADYDLLNEEEMSTTWCTVKFVVAKKWLGKGVLKPVLKMHQKLE